VESDLDAKYKHGANQSSTGAIFVADVGKPNEKRNIKLSLGGRRCGQGDFEGAVSERSRKNSNRKGVDEMVEECGQILPEVMAPFVQDVNSRRISRTESGAVSKTACIAEGVYSYEMTDT
jgi:hypothetical protein